MHAWPLIKRELAVAARRRLTFWLRFSWGAGSMMATVWAILVWGSSRTFSGAHLFQWLSGLAGITVIVTGFALAVDGISLERRDGTLPLLFLTDLTAADIVVGKLAAVSTTPLLTLLAAFPGLAVCQLVGGLAPAQFWHTMLALLTALFFTISTTLLASTLSHQRYAAAIFGIVFLLLTNPFLLLFTAARSSGTIFWGTFAGYWLGVFAFLFVSSSILGRTWRDAAKAKSTDEQRAGPLRRLAMGEHPVTWMMLRRMHRITAVHWITALSLATAGCFLALQFLRRTHVIAALTGLFLLHAIVLVGLLARTVFSFHTDKHEGSLEILLSTPLINEDIFVGLAGFLHQRFSFLLLAVTSGDALFSLMLWPGATRSVAIFPITMAGILWITFYGVRWLGIYRSLMLNTPTISILTTLWRLTFFPTVISAASLLAPTPDYLKSCVFWVISTGFLSLFFGNDARRVLLEQGRELLIRPLCDKPPHIESEWSFINWESLEESQVRTAQPMA